MRFIFGPIPHSRVLDAEERGWTALAEPDSGRFAVAASLLSLLFLVPAVFFVLNVAETNQRQLRSPFFLAALVFLLPTHEFIHALAYFKGVRSPHLVMGIWPSRGIGYAILDSPMPRNRVLLMSAAPFLALSVVPSFLPLLLDFPQRTLMVIVILVHTALCAGDFMVFTSILRQVPSKAWVHNKGWKTYSSLPPAGIATALANGVVPLPDVLNQAFRQKSRSPGVGHEKSPR
jgi:putative zincin peptidase